jgi:protein-tyrosine phosphatase
MKKKILMVCLGNICRSPLAEGILKSKSKDIFEVDSAGTSAYHQGELPDQRSISVASKNNIDISDQNSRKVVAQDFEKYDLIFAMDLQNYKNLQEMAQNQEQRNKVKLIMNEVYPGQNIDVPDPYYGGEHGFQNVFEMLDLASDKIVEKYSI